MRWGGEGGPGWGAQDQELVWVAGVAVGPEFLVFSRAVRKSLGPKLGAGAVRQGRLLKARAWSCPPNPASAGRASSSLARALRTERSRLLTGGPLLPGGPEVSEGLRGSAGPQRSGGGPGKPLCLYKRGTAPPGRPRGWPHTQPETPSVFSGTRFFLVSLGCSLGARTVCVGRMRWSSSLGVFLLPPPPLLDGIPITVPPFWTNPHTLGCRTLGYKSGSRLVPELTRGLCQPAGSCAASEGLCQSPSGIPHKFPASRWTATTPLMPAGDFGVQHLPNQALT